jgi:hypothetical protein
MWEQRLEHVLMYAVAVASLILLWVPGVDKSLVMLAALTAPAVFWSLSKSFGTSEELTGLFQLCRYAFVAWLAVAILQQAAQAMVPGSAPEEVTSVVAELHDQQQRGHPRIPVEEVGGTLKFDSADTYVVHEWSKSTALAVPLPLVVQDATADTCGPIDKYLNEIGLVILAAAMLLRGTGWLITNFKPAQGGLADGR